jgi:hypothetical protein
LDLHQPLKAVVDSQAESQTIIGFTEAEIGLVLAAVFLVLWLLASSTSHRVVSPRTAIETISRDSLEHLRARADSLLARNASLERSLDSLRGKHSRMTPSCEETHAASGPLFTVHVAGNNAFVVDGAEYNWSSLLERTALARAAAAKVRCRHQVLVSTAPDISAAAFDQALRLLRSQFYVGLLATGGGYQK